MGAFDNLLKCSLGGTSFQLQNYSVQVAPLNAQYWGRIGSTISVKGTGWIQAASAAALGAALLALPGAFQVSGQTFSIYGIGGALEYQLTPAQCVEGGPDFAFTIENQSEALIKPISFEVTAKTALAGANLPLTSYNETVTVRPDGLRTIQRDGTDVSGQFTVAELLTTFQQVYPPAQWVISYKSTSTTPPTFNPNITYSFTAVELDQPYPAVDGEGTAIVDGECNCRQVRDEQYRVNTSYDYDLLVTGDYQAVVDAIRTDAMAGEIDFNGDEDDQDQGEEAVVMRETVTVSTYKETRIRAVFEFLRGGDGTALLNWVQTFDQTQDDDAYVIQQYNGAGAVLIKQPATIKRIVQSGQAIGLGVFPMPPNPVIANAYLERPRITFTRVNSLECQTAWNYVLAAEHDFDEADYADELVRPGKPSFYGDT